VRRPLVIPREVGKGVGYRKKGEEQGMRKSKESSLERGTGREWKMVRKDEEQRTRKSKESSLERGTG
jgi:hypothetical protein